MQSFKRTPTDGQSGANYVPEGNHEEIRQSNHVHVHKHTFTLSVVPVFRAAILDLPVGWGPPLVSS